MELIVLIAGLLIVAAAAAIYLKQKSHAAAATAGESASIAAMQQQIESLRADLRASLKNVSDAVSQQLTGVTLQMQSQTDTVGNRLDNAARVIGDVQKNLGELGRATQEIKELGQNVSKLEELLRAPKLRGGLGEYLLEDLLKQVLPADHFGMQHRFRTGDVVDAVIRTSDRLVPVDSKFPLENFRRFTAAPDDERKSLRKSFVSDVKKHIDAIAFKYILPDEGTFPFALMYVPAENIYYEMIIREEPAGGAGLYSYALEKKVVPVSPNSFYAYLQVIALGLRGFYIEQRAREILDNLQQLQGEAGRVREVFDVMGTHLENARKKYDETENRLTRFEGRLENISRKSVSDGNVSQAVPAEEQTMKIPG